MSSARSGVVVGVDACKTGWVGIALQPNRPPVAVCARTIEELVAQIDQPVAVAIDIPIGLPERGTRAADHEARKVVGPRWQSVFLTPVRAALEAPTYQEASGRARALTGAGISKQAYGLRTKIIEVEQWITTVPFDVREVHPEVSFATMAGRPLSTSKKTWAGLHERLRLLDAEGIALDADLGTAGTMAGIDDVLDAAAAAWTARNIAEGAAVSLPSRPESDASGRPVAIWA